MAFNFGITQVGTIDIEGVRASTYACDAAYLPCSIKSGDNLVKYTPLAVETSTGAWRKYNSAGSDGLNTFKGILMNDCDATLEGCVGVYAYKGDFRWDTLNAISSITAGSYLSGNINIVEVV